jgi:hypothetical protein
LEAGSADLSSFAIPISAKDERSKILGRVGIAYPFTFIRHLRIAA